MNAPRTRAALALAALLAVTACNSNTTTAALPSPSSAPSARPTLAPPGTVTPGLPAMTLTSTSFSNGGTLPAQGALTGCGGANISPDLAWSPGPAGTQSYTLTEFDTDAPTGSGFWHWILFNIPATVTSLALGAGAAPPAASITGYNDYGASAYGGPCPPIGAGQHHYYFTITALNVATLPGVGPGATGAFMTFNSIGRVLAQGQLLGLYGR